MKFIDTHAHLLEESFEKDRFEVIERAFKNSICGIIEIACSSMEWQKALDLCKKYKGKIFSVFGIHPHYTDELTQENMSQLKKYLNSEFSTGVGETGLDYWWDISKKEKQFELLSQMIEISHEFEKICIFHCRNGKNAKNENAYSDLLDFLKNNWNFENRKKFRGILHCFSGNYEDAKEAIDLGLALGINGTWTYPKNENLREIVKKTGIENIVFETDCPYLAPQPPLPEKQASGTPLMWFPLPQPKRGKRNEPSSIPEIARSLSEYLNLPIERVAEVTLYNAQQIFNINPY